MVAKVVCYDHLGNAFSSKGDMCAYYGINIHIFANRIRGGWPLNEALLIPAGKDVNPDDLSPEIRELYLSRRARVREQLNARQRTLNHFRNSVLTLKRDELNERVKKMCMELVKQYSNNPEHQYFDIDNIDFFIAESLVFRAVAVNEREWRYMFLELSPMMDKLYINKDFFSAFDSVDFLTALKAFSMTGLNTKEKIPHGIAVMKRSCLEIFGRQRDEEK